MQLLERQFNKNLEEWREHCRKTINSSNSRDYLDCESYRNIVAMGPTILPLIRKEYGAKPENIDKRNLLSWLLSNPVREIVGDDFQIPNWMRGKMSVIAKYTANWLDQHMAEYVGGDY